MYKISIFCHKKTLHKSNDYFFISYLTYSLSFSLIKHPNLPIILISLSSGKNTKSFVLLLSAFSLKEAVICGTFNLPSIS